MKSHVYYILVVLLLSVTALNLTLKKATNSSIHLTEVKLKNNSVLYIKIKVISFNYIDSLSVKQVADEDETIFKFSRKTKKASLDYFINKENIISDKLIVKIFYDGKSEEFVQEVVMN
ncbi:MAG: hypothetical protein JXR68_03710 [Bacteroidales bacterium]|nr:hypothetical protein [Bacteroidales bacterium]